MAPRLAIPARASLCLAAALLAFLVGSGCAREHRLATAPARATAAAGVARPELAPPALVARALEVQNRHAAALMRLPGVVGTATALGSDGAPVVRVYVRRAGVSGIPATLDGVGVDTEILGDLRPFALDGRYRPVPIGVSLDNNQQCALGTFGCVVTRGSLRFVLSANHVLARQNQATIGEAIVQPARGESKSCVDHGNADKVAELSDYEPLRFDGSDNVIDAAIARLTVPDVDCATLPRFYGRPSSVTVAPTLNLAIKKVGRTTQLSAGRITAINATFDVTYSGGTAHFVGLFVTTHPFGKYGDSGSLIVTNDGACHPVGVLFGGDPNGTGIAYPVDLALARFGVTICGN